MNDLDWQVKRWDDVNFYQFLNRPKDYYLQLIEEKPKFNGSKPELVERVRNLCSLFAAR